jgi:hypothetical protein
LLDNADIDGAVADFGPPAPPPAGCGAVPPSETV